MISLEGRLLVATPLLLERTFTRTVILLLNHDEDGALGVVVNRPSPVAVGRVLPDWSDVVTPPSVVFEGGPVSPDSALAVAVSLGDGPPAGYQRLAPGYGLVDLDGRPGDVMPDLVGLRVFSGYAGWGAQQLESEIEEGSWYVVTGGPADLLSDEPGALWRQVLRRQPGEVAYAATFPDDPTMN